MTGRFRHNVNPSASNKKDFTTESPEHAEIKDRKSVIPPHFSVLFVCSVVNMNPPPQA